MTEEWAPIQYRGFHDIPRAFVVEHAGDLFFFDCPFDDVIDDYRAEFTVFRIKNEFKDKVRQPSWTDLRRYGDQVGAVPVDAVIFDETKRKAIDASVLKLLDEKRRE